MTAAHTAGEWTYIYSPYTAQDGSEIPAFEIHSEEKICDTNEDRPAEEQEANARILAAALDMLKALQFQQMADYDPEASERKGYFVEARRLREAAIARATGRTLPGAVQP